MKVPVTAYRNTTAAAAAAAARRPSNFNGYEPKSVLDLCRSPSPVPSRKSQTSDLSDEFSLQLDEQALCNIEDWDSLMRDIGLHDDFAAPTLKPISQLNQFARHPEIVSEFPLSLSNHNSNPSDLIGDFAGMNQWEDNTEFNFVDDLIRAADCFDSDNLQLGQVILARLNQQLPSPAGKPLQRAAFYYKESLQSLLTGSTRPTPSPSSSADVVQAIKAYKNFTNVSPIVMFSNFTANQAILEALNGAMFIHVVDFEIGFGGQWASFMKEVADKTSPPVLRITAVVPEEYAAESRLIRDNLTQFAREVKIGFQIEFVSIRSFEFLSFKSIRFMEGEKTGVLLSPTVFQRLGTGFLTDLRLISPHAVVVIDGEGSSNVGPATFHRGVIDGLEFYTTVLETLEAANHGGSEDWIEKIEASILRPKIMAAVEVLGRRTPAWREAFAAAGMRAVGLSQFADFQAECLLRKVQVRGYHVAKRQAEMVLCWQERALVATSAWRC